MTILITGRNHPDLDGLASAYALSELYTFQGKEAVIGFAGTPQVDALFFLAHFHFDMPGIPENLSGFDSIALVDTSMAQYIPAIVQHSIEKVDTVYDHHYLKDILQEFPNITHYVNEPIGACATLLVELLKAEQCQPSRRTAVLLYGAIHSNTLNFQGTITTTRDHEAAEWLSTLYLIEDRLIEEMFRSRTPASDVEFAEEMRKTFTPHVNTGSGNCGIAQIELFAAQDVLSSFTNSIYRTLLELRYEYHVPYIFLIVADIQEKMNFFFLLDRETESLLQKKLGDYLRKDEPFSIDNMRVLSTHTLLLRKQIMPLLTSA